MSFGEWPGFRIFLLIVFWVVIVFVVAAWRLYWTLPQAVENGVAAVSFDIKGPALVAFGPPLILGAAYVLLRRRSGESSHEK
jgi:hypothetical protein